MEHLGCMRTRWEAERLVRKLTSTALFRRSSPVVEMEVSDNHSFKT